MEKRITNCKFYDFLPLGAINATFLMETVFIESDRVVLSLTSKVN